MNKLSVVEFKVYTDGRIGIMSYKISIDKLAECLTKTFKPYVCEKDNDEQTN